MSFFVGKFVSVSLLFNYCIVVKLKRKISTHKKTEKRFLDINLYLFFDFVIFFCAFHSVSSKAIPKILIRYLFFNISIL